MPPTARYCSVELRRRAPTICEEVRQARGSALMLFEYSECDGSQEFTPLSAEAAFDRLSDYLMEHGEYVLRQLERLDDADADLLKMLIKKGYLEKDEKGRIVVAAKGIRRVEHKALDELFQITRKDMPGKHPSDFKGAGQVRHDDNK